jgi:hypothetical protein
MEIIYNFPSAWKGISIIILLCEVDLKKAYSYCSSLSHVGIASSSSSAKADGKHKKINGYVVMPSTSFMQLAGWCFLGILFVKVILKQSIKENAIASLERPPPSTPLYPLALFASVSA